MWRAALLCLTCLAACVTTSYRDDAVDMSAVAVDVDRYMGRWYEIARFPNVFEEGCAGVTADYKRVSKQRIQVTNTCLKGGLDGEKTVAEGRARIVGEGQLTVSFLPEQFSFLDGLASGDYWVLWLDEDYAIAVVGEPSGRTGWILARSPNPPEDLIDAALGELEDDGYRIAELIWTEQPQQSE